MTDATSASLKSSEAVDKAADAAAAIEEARMEQIHAANRESEDRMAQVFKAAIKEAFSVDGGAPKKFIDITRIPLICQDIAGINKTLGELAQNIENGYVKKESFTPVRIVVYGFVGIILTSVIIAIVTLVINKQ